MPRPCVYMLQSEVYGSDPDAEERFNTFYETEHIPDILSFPSSLTPKAALRYKRVSSDPPAETAEDRPYTALYPLDDIAVLGGNIARSISANVSTRPSKVYGTEDRVAIYAQDHHYPYRKVTTIASSVDLINDDWYASPCIVLDFIKYAPGTNFLSFGSNFAKDYRPPPAFSKHDAYLRTVAYKRMDQGDPAYLAIHEFDCAADVLGVVARSDDEADAIARREVYKLVFWMGNKLTPPP